MKIRVRVNGEMQEADVAPRTLLVHWLREDLGLTGTHIGCETSLCGACTVHVNGRAVKSCTMFAVQADGAEVKTIEAMGEADALHPLQIGFWEIKREKIGRFHPSKLGNFDRERLTIDDRAVEEV